MAHIKRLIKTCNFSTQDWDNLLFSDLIDRIEAGER
jgi:hypothetical protein